VGEGEGGRYGHYKKIVRASLKMVFITSVRMQDGLRIDKKGVRSNLNGPISNLGSW